MQRFAFFAFFNTGECFNCSNKLVFHNAVKFSGINSFIWEEKDRGWGQPSLTGSGGCLVTPLWCLRAGPVTQPLWKSLAISLKTKHIFTTQGNHYTLCIYLREMNTFAHKSYMQILFVTVLFIITNNWKQPRWLSTGK